MNLKILTILIIYYACLSSFILFAPINFSGYSAPNPLNNTALTNSEIDTGGVFTGGISFSRFFGLVTIGIGLPNDTPQTMKFFIALIQSCITVFTIGFIIDAIWSG